MISWGIIGCGGIARRRMLPAAQHLADSRFVAVMDVDRAATDEVAAQYGCRAHYTEADLLADPDVQAVYIATPVYLHHRQVCEAARAGKHILVEKPLALTADQAREMLIVSRDSGVFLTEGYMMKYHSLNQAARRMVADGDIGDVVFARAQISCWYPKIPGAWRQDPAQGGGGALMDMATHCYDLLETIIGSRITEVACLADTLIHDYPVDDSSTTLLRFASGAHGVVDAFYNVPDSAGQGRLELYGPKGSILAEGTIGQMPGGRMVAYLSDSGKEYDPLQSKDSLDVAAREITAEPVNMYAAEVDYLSRCISAGTAPEVNTGEEGLHVLEVALAAYQSSRTGQRIKVA